MQNPNDTDTSNSSAYSDFGITHEDAFFVRDYLRRFVPSELAYLILNAAHYWPCVSAERTDDADPFTVLASSSTGAAAYYLVTPPIPADPGTRPVQIQGVVFTMRSLYQGAVIPVHRTTLTASPSAVGRFSDTYNDSRSWFEAGIVRDSLSLTRVEEQLLSEGNRPRTFKDFDDAAFGRGVGREVENPLRRSRRWKVQYNMQVTRTVRCHQIVWTKDNVFDDSVKAKAKAEAWTKGAGTGRGFVSMLRPGDRVALVVKAQYRGRVNHVFGATIKIFYSV
ncbi:hypothetical protein D9615_010461 [Tricholomella constricta]|uniref:Uncharacterized protein n=1 Tax=Tricholomella constricta TaxID=117010 RepID=A0A8H5GLK7_9AGAR|nr:hypothetical protein D9615_010461 [Tricholomella constricta]